MQHRTIRSVLPIAILALILGFGFWLRAPRIGAGLPFLYDEDEGHHHNRVVQMVQEGRFNPKYFRKPSLHFYLRMPVVAAAFLFGVREGHLREIGEIRTYDRFGLSKYPYTTSHPGIVKANRLLSVVLGLLTILVTYAIGSKLAGHRGAGIVAALLVAGSPALVEYGATVGVDVVMMAFVAASAAFAVLIIDRVSLPLLTALGLCCGLAVSSKYNAAPVAVLPFLVVLTSTRRFEPAALLLALVTPAIGFLLGTPFLLAELPLFLNQVAYEVWHYGIAGHEGHSAEPGVEQASFYLTWLVTSGVGIAAAALAAIGTVLCLVRAPRVAVVALAFPVLFGLLMISQRANFVRNMLVMIPFVAAFSAAGLLHLVRLVSSSPRTVSLVFSGLAFLTLLDPLGKALAARIPDEPTDSRLYLQQWLREKLAEAPEPTETVAAGQLLLPYETRSLPGVSVLDLNQRNPVDIYLMGFDRAVVGAIDWPKFGDPAPYLKLETRFEGERGPQRIVRNPLIQVYVPNREAGSELAPDQFGEYRLTLSSSGDANEGLDCFSRTPLITGSSLEEGHCWLHSLFTALELPPNLPGNSVLSFEAMSPWSSQTLQVSAGGESALEDFSTAPPGSWIPVELRISASGAPADGVFRISRVRSPAALQIGSDRRRLGVAVRNFRLIPLRHSEGEPAR